MSSTLVDLKTEHERAIAKADEIIAGAERVRRPLSTIERGIVDKCLVQARELKTEIDRVGNTKARRADLAALRSEIPTRQLNQTPGREPIAPKQFSSEYQAAFHAYLRSGSPSEQGMVAALTEGSNSAGGYAVPVEVDSHIVPLAPSDFAVRQLATVVPTTCDRKVPKVTALPAAAAKSEGSAFGVSNSALGQFTLASFVVGIESDASIEAFDDIPLFNATVLRDNTLAAQIWEEGKFLTGSGSGEPQGLLANVDNGVAAAVADGDGNLLSIATTYDVMGALKGAYLPNASWLFSRATGIALRKAQAHTSTGLYEPVFTRENGRDYLHGHPVAYSEQMPAIAAGATPVVFGDFASAYLIGDRGGSAIRMKILDQVKISLGLVTLLTYRRTDGRVRCPEALKTLTLHS